MLIELINESTLLDDQGSYNIAWALDYQLTYHFGRSGWRPDVRCHYLTGGAQAIIPPGHAALVMKDVCDQPGALGYHDEDGNEIPTAIVGVKTARDDGQSESEVASHEALELAADPHVNLSALTGDGKRLYALEVGDPVQGTGYDVGEPEGRAIGIRVANFALPAYFDPRTTTEKVDFRGVLKAPFTVGSQGYMSYIDMANPTSGWQQQLGAERSSPPTPDKDDRLARR